MILHPKLFSMHQKTVVKSNVFSKLNKNPKRILTFWITDVRIKVTYFFNRYHVVSINILFINKHWTIDDENYKKLWDALFQAFAEVEY